MYREEIAAISNGAEAKVRLLKENPGGYIIMSLLGGIHIDFVYSRRAAPGPAVC